MNFPTLDFSSDDTAQLGRDLVHHLSTSGFVYLRNHGVSEEVMERSRQSARDFFKMDHDFKMKSIMTEESKPWGYKPFASERLNPDAQAMDAKEVLMYGAIDPPSNAWPTSEVGDSTSDLMSQLNVVTRRVLSMLGTGLGLAKPDFFLKAHTVSNFALRYNFYPFMETGQNKLGQVKCSEHHDWGSISLLLQDKVPGLEAQTVVGGEYVELPPIEGTILLILGYMMETWTNGRLRAIMHRVVKPLDRERLSINYFVHPNPDTEAEPLKELVGEGVASKYVKTSSEGYSMTQVDRTTRE